MKTMNDLTWYCSAEQANRARVLGAPLAKATRFDLLAGHKLLGIISGRLLPTIEQMVSWFAKIGIILIVDAEYSSGELSLSHIMYYWKIIDLNIPGERRIVRMRGSYCNSLWGAYYSGIDETLDYLEERKEQ